MSTTTASRPQLVNLTDLDVSQLSEVRRQLEEVLVPFSPDDLLGLTFVKELNHLTNSFAQLKQAQAKFKACIENIGEMQPEKKSTLSRNLVFWSIFSSWPQTTLFSCHWPILCTSQANSRTRIMSSSILGLGTLSKRSDFTHWDLLPPMPMLPSRLEHKRKSTTRARWNSSVQASSHCRRRYRRSRIVWIT